MDIHFTARRFRPQARLRNHAISEVKKLDKFYDGIVRCDVILSYEGAVKSDKIAEINLHVSGSMLTAKEKSDDYYKSIDLAVVKIERQLAKHKTKVRMKNKKTLRRVKEAIAPSTPGDEE